MTLGKPSDGGRPLGLLLLAAPGRTEVDALTPLDSDAGALIAAALKRAGSHRARWAVDYVSACRAPGDDLRKALAKVGAENRRRQRVNTARKREARAARTVPDLLPSVLSPLTACGGRLEQTLREVPFVVAFGAHALAAAAPDLEQGISLVRGAPLEVHDAQGQLVRRVLPVTDPQIVLTDPRWRETFYRDVARAVRYAQGRLRWREPEIVWQPSPQALSDFLWSAEIPFHTVDIETASIRITDNVVRCIGFGAPSTPDRPAKALVVSLISRERHQRGAPLWPPAWEAVYWEVINEWLAEPTRRKYGHNLGYFDRGVLRNAGRADIQGVRDTLLFHSVADSEMPHGLGFVATYYDTDVPGWKATHAATTEGTDAALAQYNGMDCAVNAEIVEPLREDVEAFGQRPIASLLHRLQPIALAMHELGQGINLHAVTRHRERLTAEVNDYSTRFKAQVAELGLAAAVEAARAADNGTRRRSWHDEDAADDDPLVAVFVDSCPELSQDEVDRVTSWRIRFDAFNPTSPVQIRHLLFEHLGLALPVTLSKKDAFTSSGDISTNDAVLRALVADRSTPAAIRDLIDLLRRLRGSLKPLGFPIARLHYDEHREGLLYRDGRLRSDWKIHVAVTTRWASSPNTQNWPVSLRDAICAGPGCGMVGADYDQIELRLAAARWRLARYLDALKRGEDPHQTTMNLAYGDGMWNWEGAPPQRYFKKGIGKGSYFDVMRDLAKRLFYASLYGAELETIYRVITAAENDEGALLFADLTVDALAVMHGRLMQNLPELTAGWDKEIAFHAQHGYVEEPVTGRRRRVASKKPNEILNFPIQGSAAGLVNHALLRVVEALPHGGPDGPGVTNQMHDALYGEWYLSQLERVTGVITEAMTTSHPAFPDVVFPAEAHHSVPDEDGVHTMLSCG